MIHRQTTLILGAGATQRYGLPLGKDLVGHVVERIRASADHMDDVATVTNHPRADFLELASRLRASEVDTIDAWLERNSRFLTCGKTCLAFQILFRENPDSLTGGWLRYIWNLMIRGAAKNAKQMTNGNRISFITFNYDRVLETFFHRAMSNTYADGQQDIAACMRDIPIIHLHGQCGVLPQLALNGGRATAQFGAITDANAIDSWRLAAQHADGIRLGFQAGDAAEIARARHYMGDAERLIFIGFGFAPENMKKLCLAPRAGQTAVGLDFEGTRETWTRKHRTTGLGYDVQMHAGNDIEQFLRAHLQEFG